MAARKTRRASAANQLPTFHDDEFTAGENFVFELDKSVGRMTRSRRSSISSQDLVKPKNKSRRQTMMPTVSEEKIPSRKYTKPVMAVSPTKNSKFLNDDDILAKLDDSDPKPVKASKPSKVISTKVKSPIKSRIPIKSPPSAKKQTKPSVRRSRRVSGDASTLQPVVKPTSKVRRQTMLPVLPEVASPKKVAAEAKSSMKAQKPSPKKAQKPSPEKVLKPSPKKKMPKSSPKKVVPVDAFKEVKKVEIKLKQMKIKEDPNLIFSLLEESLDEENPVGVVIDQILEMRKEASPVTRQKKSSDAGGKSAKKSPVKKASKTPMKETKTPRRTARNIKTEIETPEVKTLPKVEKKSTPKVEVKSPPVKLTPAKTTSIVMDNSSKKRKPTEEPSRSTPVRSKRLKLDKSASKTPGSETKASRTTPTLIEKYKQVTPGSLKKPLKRLAAKQFTPAQVKPSDVLRRNMVKKVEKEILQKLKNKPNSSPYALKSGENSPVFTKVESAAKRHITGTPVRPMPRRKFGTTIQPNSLLEDSVAPNTEMIKRYSNSTPVRPRLNEPHPLESVEATPIRPPPSRPEPMSPPPEMITGKLGSLCSIM